MTELSSTAIAKAIGSTRQAVLTRAEKERWLCKGEGKSLRFLPRSLPRDVLMALTTQGIIETGAEVEPRPDPSTADSALLAGTDKEREKAQFRSALVGLYLHNAEELNVFDFVASYNAGQVSPSLLSKLGTISGPTFYRWIGAYRIGGHNPAALMPKYSVAERKRGGGASLSEIAKHYLEFYWLRDSRPSMRSAWIEARLALPKEEISYPTAARYLGGIPAVIRDYKRHGINRMETRDLPYIERNMALYRAMDQLVSDHHCFDFLVEKDGNLFRPWITAVQDFRSSKIVGFWPSVYPSSLSISLAFYLAVSRFGSCKLIHIDNGKDYRSMVLNGGSKALRVLNEEGFLEEELVQIQGAYSLFSERVTFARPYHGASKGRMERTFGTFAQLFSRRMAGYVGSNTVERPEDAALYWRALNKKQRRHDVYTWDGFVRMLASFVDFYNAEWRGEGNGMDGRAPDEVFAATSGAPRPVSPEILALAFSRADTRRVGRNGVTFDGVRYWSDDLLKWKGLDVIVRRRIDDPETVLVSDHRGAHICSATANYFLETGDLAVDNERLNSTKKKGLAMVRDGTVGTFTAPEGSRSLVDFAGRAYPARATASLPLAAGAEADGRSRPDSQDLRAVGPKAEDLAHKNSFIDRIGKDE